MPTLEQIHQNNNKQMLKGLFAIRRKKVRLRTPKFIGGNGPARVMEDPIATLGHPARPRKRKK